MIVQLEERMRRHVIEAYPVYFTPEMLSVLPRKLQTVEEALADYENTLLPGAKSFGRCIYLDGRYVGDVWIYAIDPGETPQCMLSIALFDANDRGKGIGTQAVGLMIREIQKRFHVTSVGAFTYSDNTASRRALVRNGFQEKEIFEEDGHESVYLEIDLGNWEKEG